MKKAIGYVRRSSKSEKNTVSLDVQTAAVVGWARKEGYEIVSTVTDDGVSGGDRDRLGRIDAALLLTGAAVVIVYNLDRFARDVAGQLDKLREYKKRGIELVVGDRGPVDVESATGFLTTGVEGLLAEHYRRLVSEKTKDALDKLRKEGRRFSGKIPYGFKLVHRVHLEEDAREQEVIRIIHLLRGVGYSLREIADGLRDDGFTARSGNAFAPSTIRAILGRKLNGTDR